MKSTRLFAEPRIPHGPGKTKGITTFFENSKTKNQGIPQTVLRDLFLTPDASSRTIGNTAEIPP
jgi:hypothetical protein